MTTTFKLGRVAGVEVGVNWSWLIVVALIVWALAAGVFPETNPGLSDGAYLAMAFVAAVLFFLSIFLHELGHAVQARREGMEIDGITLWVFGGVARFKGSFPSAGAEFRIAIAGPVVSLAIAMGFLAAALALPLPDGPDGVVFWVGYINFILLAFNMLPALPLDGGRVLRAALWHFRGDFGVATRLAAGLGRGFGQVLIAAGLAVLIFGGVIAGVWLAFIGWFLLMAAEGEASVAKARGALADLKVRDVMVPDPVTAPPDMTLDRFMNELFFPHRHTAYPVIEDGGRALGLISFRSVVPLPREEWSLRRVRDALTPIDELLVLEADAELGEVLIELAQSELNRAVVCERGKLVGLLSMTDAARLLEALGERTLGTR